jgi:hypothetical protein
MSQLSGIATQKTSTCNIAALKASKLTSSTTIIFPTLGKGRLCILINTIFSCNNGLSLYRFTCIENIHNGDFYENCHFAKTYLNLSMNEENISYYH